MSYLKSMDRSRIEGFKKLTAFPKEEVIHAPDIALCSSCNGRFKASDCETEWEGSFEEGYYPVHVCPECEDGGCIDDYGYSDESFSACKES